MIIKEKTLDDLMMKVFSCLLEKPFDIETSRSKKLGPTSEQIVSLLVLENPLARLSRSETRGKPFSALAELLWYISGNNDLEFIKYYIQNYAYEAEEDSTKKLVVHGGYGPRLFKMHGKHNQIENILNQLKRNQNTRKAVIQLFDAGDLAKAHKDIPCTCSLQFLAREGRLNLFCTMRSNDAFWGLPHDIFCFTMLQEIIARELKLELGKYYHSVGSLHMYEKHKNEAKVYINEGYQSTKIVMPKMPDYEPLVSIQGLVQLEESMRRGIDIDYEELSLHPYWQDLIRLLELYRHSRDKPNKKRMLDTKKLMSTSIFDVYIDKRINEAN